MSIYSSRPVRGYPALTLVEVLVVFVTISLSVVIFLPLLTQVREYARQMLCQDKLRRLTTGVLDFESARGALPAGAFLNDVRLVSGNTFCQHVGTDAGGPSAFGNTQALNGCFDIFGLNGAPNFSWIVNILPYIDRQDLYDAVNFSLTAQDHFLPPTTRTSSLPRLHINQHASPRSQLPVFANRIESLLCPTDSAIEVNYSGVGAIGFNASAITAGGGFAKTNYVGFVSAVHLNHFDNRRGALGGFQLGSLLGQTISQITDGVSNTMFLSEVRRLDRDWDSRGVWGLAFPGTTLVAADYHSVIAGSDPYIPDPSYGPENVALPNTQTYWDFVVGVTSANEAYTQAQQMPAGSFTGTGAFMGAAPRSLHPGGVYASALDGHVCLISNQIDPIVYAYLVYTRDGQVTDFGCKTRPFLAANKSKLDAQGR